jgi:hypothetical protein
MLWRVVKKPRIARIKPTAKFFACRNFSAYPRRLFINGDFS